MHTDRIAGEKKLEGRDKWEAIKRKWSPIERALVREDRSNGRRPLEATRRHRLAPH